MAATIQNNFRTRKNFAKIQKIIDIPNLIDIQKHSYDKFLQADVAPEQREDSGLQGVFKSVFPIKDFNETSSLEFVSYHLEKPKYDVDECHQRGMTYSAPIKVVVRLVVWDKDEETGAQSIRDVKEQEVYFGEIPLMTENGTFIINGTERVVVSQLHRSPGAFFDHDKGKSHSSGKLLYNARIIPYRGSWIDFEFDHKVILYVRIDRRRKLPATVLLRALGAVPDTAKKSPIEFKGTPEEMLNFFYATETISIGEKGKYEKSVELELLPGQRATRDNKNPKTGEVIVKKNRKFTRGAIKKLEQAKIRTLPLDVEELVTKISARDVVDENTGEVLLECNEEVTEEKVEQLRERGIDQFQVLFIDNLNVGPFLRDTLMADKIASPEEAIMEIYRRLRPGDPPTLETATNLFVNLFFNPERYDLSKVGRLKLNYKFAIDEPLEQAVLTKKDILEVVRYLIDLKNGKGQIDDIDHLGNRRVRAVGELLENQYRIGLVRMERAIKERMSLQEIETLMPHDLINAKPVTAVIKEFFGSSQLSQFMDQTNPLSEVTHKRRLSALGPGGLTRERAGFEVRDVHPTHYGRICPIETPEGPNIGLIASLACYARINEFGFIEAPYRKVVNGVVTEFVRIRNGGDTKFKPFDHVPAEDVEKANKRVGAHGVKASFEPDPFYLTAWEEDKHVVGQANIALDENGYIVNDRNAARKAGEFILAQRDEIEFVDVSPKQLVSVAASLIPFLENDDANRALMGSNMQRQSVPLLRAEAPYIGTGMEDVTARDSGAVVIARRDGVVDYTDSERIIVKADHNIDGTISREVTADIYTLIKFKRSNQNTCINQRPIVHVGERVAKGQVIADGPCTDRGELALGRNVLVAFMPWRGYNFEDAILVSERLVKEDYYTSIHIEELEIEARDTKLGPEEITRDIPNVGENMLRDLDESGIIRIGAQVKPGSILVGKVTPKGETQLTAEEKLLRAIFGEKAGDVKDASLVCPPGIDGTVVDVQVFTRKGQEKDERSLAIEQEEENRLRRDLEDEIRILREQRDERIYELLEGRKLSTDLTSNREVVIPKNVAITREMLQAVEPKALRKVQLASSRLDIGAEIKEYEDRTERQIKILSDIYEEKIAKLRQGDELAPGVIKMVKVFIAMKRKLSVGDKMAGRHGNKGVIARILPEEDMPYLPDGTPVEIVLNPLGVPSRMNVGQILETHLGWAAHALGLYFATPVFDGATEQEIKNWLDRAGLPKGGKTQLFDGMTGDKFEQDTTVGYIYMLKLSHLVDDKIHARSIGPYSLITQQPLGGKAQFGGQRFGEMEVWALEAYGSAHILQELLTVKSDDVYGRTKIYEAIVKGEAAMEPGVPESFNVLIRELQSLCLDVELIKAGEKKPVLSAAAD